MEFIKWRREVTSWRSSVAPSLPTRFAILQQQNHQAALERSQFAAVVLQQDGRQFAAEARQAGRRGAVGHVEQRVEELLPQLAVGMSAEPPDNKTTC